MKRTERRAPTPGGKICAFTGHRPKTVPYLADVSDPAYRDLKCRLEKRIRRLIEEGYLHYLCGGALGSDILAAGLILELQDEFPEVTLEIVQPCPQQAERWSKADRETLERILARADRVTVTGVSYLPGCTHLRNRFMVDECDLLIALYNGSPGGTRTTLEYALKNGKNTVIVTP